MRNEDRDPGRTDTERRRTTYPQQQTPAGASGSNDYYPLSLGLMNESNQDRSGLVSGGPIEPSVDRTMDTIPGAFNPPTPPDVLFSIQHSDRLPISTTGSDPEMMPETGSGSEWPMGSNRNPSLTDDLRAVSLVPRVGSRVEMSHLRWITQRHRLVD